MATVEIKSVRLTGSEPGWRVETVTSWLAGSKARQHRHRCRRNFHVWSILSGGWREVSRRATRSMGVSSWISNLRSSKGRKNQSRSMNIPERDRLRQGVVRPRARWHHHVDSGQRRSRAVKSPGAYPFWRSASGICRITVSTACFQASKVFGTTWKSLYSGKSFRFTRNPGAKKIYQDHVDDDQLRSSSRRLPR